MTIVEELGARLRAVRLAKSMTLEDLDRASAERALSTRSGRFTSSAIAAYERGTRTISVPRLHDLAAFYDVPLAALLGQLDETPPGPARKVVFDLEALRRLAGRDPGALCRVPEVARVERFAGFIEIERGDFNGRVLSIRHGDLPAIGALIGADTPDAAIAQLDAWGVLAR